MSLRCPETHTKREVNIYNFTRRELEVARLIDQHLTFDEIATHMGLSRRTVKYYADNMRLKLGVKRARHIPKELKDLGYSLTKEKK